MGNDARSPQLLVLANGATLPGVIDAEISSSSHLAADRFRLRVALGASDPSLWTSPSLLLEIRLGIDAAWTSLLLGTADRIRVDPMRGEVVVDGRDLAARLIESYTQETFENRTASEIAEILAERHDLLPMVTATTTLVGRRYQNDHARTTLNQHARSMTEWDLLTRLAEGEDFDVWVSGQKLFFAPREAFQYPIFITPQSCMEMSLERTLSLDGALQVVVKSWDCRGQLAINQAASGPEDSGDTAAYILVRPNLSADAAQALAKRVLGQMTQQARLLSFEMPGELTMMPRMPLVLGQTGTGFDGNYVVSSVERRISFRHGFIQSVQAKRAPWTTS